ncbi:MBL fold metallo-hydrolase [Radiobacillus sp. PE A8.2]|uniref:MBL fold metallo-hydrolase n=1 Tax=Radiobacillus sp. PE A8.2 TaxID=3380349 RepID=UPI00388F151B
MNIAQLSVGPLGTNCYIVSKNNQSVIIDPGGDSDQIVQLLEANQFTPLAILLTHAHFDHIGAVDELRGQYGIPVYVHELESDWLPNPNLNGSSLFRTGVISVKEADQYIEIGKMEIGSLAFEVRHTPGHSPGSVSYVFHEQQVVIDGDTLFDSGIGRTDLPGGETDQLLASIRTELFSLADDYVVYPGHGPSTEIGIEKRDNPFLKTR